MFCRSALPLSHLAISHCPQVGFKRTLVVEDMFLLPSSQKPRLVTARFNAALRAQGAHNRSWLRAIIKVTWAQWFVAPFFYKAIYLVGFGFLPWLLKGILQFLEGDTTGPLAALPGWSIALLLALDTLVVAVFMQIGWGELCRAATIHRTVVQQWVMEKSLRLTAASRHVASTGQIVTLMAVDADRIANGIIFSHWSYICCVQLAIVVVYMVEEIGGIATACASVVVVLLIIFQWSTASTLRQARDRTTKMTDVRSKLINEVVQGIRVIKAYAWEAAATRQVEAARSEELKSLRTLLILMGAYGVRGCGRQGGWATDVGGLARVRACVLRACVCVRVGVCVRGFFFLSFSTHAHVRTCVRLAPFAQFCFAGTHVSPLTTRALPPPPPNAVPHPSSCHVHPACMLLLLPSPKV